MTEPEEPEEPQETAGYPADQSPFQRRAAKPALQRTFPVAQHLPAYRQRPFVRDLTAGLTVGALAIPAAMAHAGLIGVPPVHGLYVLLLPLIAYAVFGSSRQVIIGPEAGISGMLGAALVGLGGGDPSRLVQLASLAALMAGACFLIARVLRLGWVADYFSRAVLVGYLHGIVVVLIVGQLSRLTGVSSGESDTIPQLIHAVTHLGEVHGLSLALGLVSIGVVLSLGRVAPRLPSALIVVVAGIVVSSVADLETRGVALLGAIPSGLPNLAIPTFSAADVRHLLPVAAAVFVVSFADSILTARSFAGQHNQSVDADQELFALGMANLASGVTQGFSPSASGSRTAVNDQMGARTQIAGLISVLLVVLVLLFLTAPMTNLPSPVLAALIVTAAVGIVSPASWRSLAASGRVPVAIAAITTAGVVVLGILPALSVAVALSILEVVARGAHPHDAVLGYVPRLGRYGDVRFHPTAEVTPGIVVYRLDDRIFFANTTYMAGRINEAIDGAPWEPRVLVFDAERVSGVDASGVIALEQLTRSLRARGIELVIARASTPVAAQLERGGIVALVGEHNMHPTVRAAVDANRPPS